MVRTHEGIFTRGDSTINHIGPQITSLTCNPISNDLIQYERWVISELLEMQPYAPHIYIGADDIQEEGTYIWAATRQPLSYTNWAPSEPTGQGQRGDGEEDCLALQSSYGGWGWNDMCCTCSYRPVVCEYWLFVDFSNHIKCSLENSSWHQRFR